MADDLDTFNPVRGPARERIDAQELDDADERAAVILDRRRRRPRYFDDRFLTARDLTRGQQYTLLRQADLAQLSGSGIVHGLEVHTDAKGTLLRIDSGLGIARTGESMALRGPVQVTVAKLRVVDPQTRTTRLVAEAATGPGTGMYVLVAHPVEYSRNAAATFPNGTAAKIELADTEIVEGTWFALMPLPSSGTKDVVARGRARLAREVFVGGFDPTLSTDGLCIAVVGIVNGRVQWVDQGLTSRSVGADAVVGFGLQSRKGRLAYQAQYARHLAEEVERRRSAGLPDGLPAVEAFAALPPVGPLPRGAVEVTPVEVRQSFFPREIYVEIAIMPEDELPALLSEGLLGAPIDLEAGSEALEGVPVLIVVPVPRAGFDQQTPRMEGAYRAPAVAATGRQLVNARPIDALLVLRRKNEREVWSDPSPLDLEAWRKAVESASQLWYVRRPQFATTSVVVPRNAPTDEETDPIEALDPVAVEHIVAAGEVERFNHLFGGASKAALTGINALLLSDFLVAPVSPPDDFAPATETSVYVSGIMGELAYLARRLRPASVTDPTIIPPSPVFANLGVGDRLRLRPIEIADVDRTARRFTTPGVVESLRGPGLRSPILRSVLATSAVVPELAVWVSGATLSSIVTLAAAADITHLRAIAASVNMQPPEPEDTPVEEALSFKLLQQIGEEVSLRAIWTPSYPGFRERLDEMLVTLEHGGSPVFATATLMQVITIGFELDTQTDAQVVAILDALAKEEFESPNQSDGKLLGEKEYGPRDLVLESAELEDTETVNVAQLRLGEIFGEPEETGPEVYRLLSLASASFEHITHIAKADELLLADFAEAALKAMDFRSVGKMRDALKIVVPD